MLSFQNISYYGLLDKGAILSPSTTGEYVEVAYHPGYCYAAYKSEDINQVIIHSFDLHKSYYQNLLGFKYYTVCYKAPEFSVSFQ